MKMLYVTPQPYSVFTIFDLNLPPIGLLFVAAALEQVCVMFLRRSREVSDGFKLTLGTGSSTCTRVAASAGELIF